MSPVSLYIELNSRCNLACEHCDFWRTDRRMALSDETIAELIATWADMGGKNVVTCGGEASLEGERFWALHAAARRAKIGSFSVTNGTRITEANVGRWVTEGPSEITVSLDSHDPDKHDMWRGAPNWHVAVRALKLLLAQKPRPRVYAMTIVSERNYRELPALYALCYSELGVDKLKLNIAQPTFGWRYDDPWFEANAIKDPEALIATIDTCDAAFGITDRNPAWKEDVLMYCRSVLKNGRARRGWTVNHGTERNICNSADRNVWVSWKGVGRLCPSSLFPGRFMHGGHDLRALWEGATWREEMRSCTRYCGISHSVRREPSRLRAREAA